MSSFFTKWTTVLLVVGMLAFDGVALEGQEIVPFSSEQSAAGKAAYIELCAACHGEVLEGSGVIPALSGPHFESVYAGRSADTLAADVWRMPPDASVQQEVSDSTFANLMAYILDENGGDPGREPLPDSRSRLEHFAIPAPRLSDVDIHMPTASGPEKTRMLESLPKLTDGILGNPTPNDWVHWGGVYQGWNFSPLTQIARDNVHQLEVAWSIPLRFAPNMSTPLVYQGVMFLHVFPDTVLALDASNGQILWRYQHPLTTSAAGKLGIALGHDHVYVPTSDLGVLAIDAKTGGLSWRGRIEVERGIVGSLAEGHYLRSAPVVVGDVVIQGVAGPLMPQGNFIVGLDAHSGQEIWRFKTIPAADEAGDASWEGIPPEARSGGSVWHYGTYEPELDLVYFGVSQTYDTAPLVAAARQPYARNKALYTDSTVALDPNTGELKWFYQHQAAEQWDLDWAFERQIMMVSHEGRERKALVTMGKLGILDALDAATGAYLFSMDAGVQNYVLDIHPTTGAKLVDTRKLPHDEIDILGCPHMAGVRNWPTNTYDPQRRRLFVSSYETCARITMREGGPVSSGLFFEQIKNPGLPTETLGRILAMGLQTRSEDWEHQQAAPISTSLLSTASGLVFAGDVAPSLTILDADTGSVIHREPLSHNPSAGIVTYASTGRQYVVVSVGLTDNLTRLKSEFYRRASGAAAPSGQAQLLVFSLPEK